MVRTTKEGLSHIIQGNWARRLADFTLQQHVTPHTTTGRSPAELLMGRKLSTMLDRLHPDRAPEKSTRLADSPSKPCTFQPEDPVFARNYAQGPLWIPAVISRATGPISYEVTAPDGRVLRRHVDQLRRRTVGPTQTAGAGLERPQPERRPMSTSIPEGSSSVPVAPEGSSSAPVEPDAPGEQPTPVVSSVPPTGGRNRSTDCPSGGKWRAFSATTVPSSLAACSGNPAPSKRLPAHNSSDEEDQQPSPKKRCIISDSSSEEEFHPGQDDFESDSDSISSGLDEDTISDPAPESPEQSPPRKRPASKLPAVTPKVKKPSIVAAVTSGTWAHLSYDFLKEGKRRDAAGRLASHPEFNPRTLLIPDSFKAKLTPAMRQWWDMKAEHLDVVLFFKVGKFYELYHMDAVIGVEQLGLGDFAHSGFPEIAYGRYSEALIQKGYKVARVEQTETPQMMEERCRKMHRPSKFDRVVRREICRITCLATRTFGPQDGQLCNPELSYLFAIVHGQESANTDFGICFVDTSVGKFHLGQFSDDSFCSKLRTAVSHHPPAQSDPALPAGLRQVFEGPLHSVPQQALRPGKELWDVPHTLRRLREGAYFGDKYPAVLQSFLDPADSTNLTPQENGCLALKALGACVWYLSKSLIEEEVLTMCRFEKYVPPQSSDTRQDLNNLILDGVCLQNLEVVRNSSRGTEGTLLATMDFCCTPFGKRLFQQWLCSPPRRVDVIEDRQRAVDDLLRFPHEVQKTRELLCSLPDLERLLARIHSQSLARNSSSHPDQRAILYEDTAYNKRKIANLLQALGGFQKAAQVAPLWADALSSLTSHTLAKCLSVGPEAGQFPDLADALEFFEKAFDHEQARKEGRVTPMSGVDDEYDEAMQSVK
ncbi:hypothetical protein MRX96_025748, partial [Rhipicephalus microplus]